MFLISVTRHEKREKHEKAIIIIYRRRFKMETLTTTKTKETLKKILNFASNKTKGRGDYDNTSEGERRFVEDLYIAPINEYTHKHDSFLQNLKETSENGTFIIRGYAGAGKSAYLIYCCNELRKKHEVEKIDLPFVSKDSVYLLGKTWKNPHYKTTLSLLLNGILMKISEIISKNNDKYDTWADFYDSTMDEDYSDIFNLFKSGLSFKEMRTALRTVLGEILNSNLCGDWEKQELNERYIRSIKYFLRLLMILRISTIAQEKNYYLFIDGIEEFIHSVQVFNSEITMIRKMLHNLINECADAFNSWGKVTEWKQIKIVLAYRDTTEKMMRTLDSSDNVDESAFCDVSMWYSSKGIIEKRFEFFSEHFEDNNKLQSVIRLIFENDENKRFYDVFERISDLYSQNKRRTFYYIVDILTDELCDAYLNMNKLYEFSQKVSDKTPEEKRIIEVLKRLGREMIMRAIWENIKKSRHFERLSVLNTNGIMYMRRILNYLNNKTKLEEKNEINSYVSFKDLISDCFLKDSSKKPSDEMLKELANILYHMNLWGREHHNWSQLIVIKYNDEMLEDVTDEKVRENLDNKLRELFECDDKQKYGVKITLTGRSFLRYIISYEYFACRYSDVHTSKAHSVYDKKSIIQILCESFVLDDNGTCVKANLKKSTINRIKDALDSTRLETLGRFEDDTFLNEKGCLPNVLGNSEEFYEQKYSIMHSTDNFLYSNKDRSRKFTHIEFVLDSHISYLSYLRVFLIWIANKVRKEISEDASKNYYTLATIVLQLMSKYVSAFEFYCKIKGEDGHYYFTGGTKLTKPSKYRDNLKNATEKEYEYIYIDKA